MSEVDIERLNSIDLTQITVRELSAMQNVALRRALLEVIGNIGEEVAHHSHGAHSNHYKTISIDPEQRFETQRFETQ